MAEVFTPDGLSCLCCKARARNGYIIHTQTCPEYQGKSEHCDPQSRDTRRQVQVDALRRYERFVSLLATGRRDRYYCPSCGARGDGHGLKVDPGNRGPLFVCFTCCPTNAPEYRQARNDILVAMGLTWADVLGDLNEMEEYVQSTPASPPGEETRPEASEPAGGDTSVALRAELHRLRIQQEARRLLDAEQRPPVALPEILTLRERLAQPVPPVAWRIQDWQPADARVILAAQFKAGKTTMTGNLARSLVDGDPFLGQHKVTPIRGRLALFDFEMSARQLDVWLRDQRIVNDDLVVVLPLRGSAAAFDLLDPAARTRWAGLLRDRGVGYVLWDCFRPVLDALGLDEHRDAGRLLVGFDALLREAGISESLIVHHMGHTGERSRGDSRIRDWPDVEWRLVRQDADDPASPRFVTAFGRDVDVAESQLSYDPATRHLTLLGGSRKDAAARAALDDVLALLDTKPGLSVRGIQDGMAESDHTRGTVRAAVKMGVSEGVIGTDPGPRNSILHTHRASVPQCAASVPAQSSECASVPIEGTLHSDTLQGASVPAAQCCKGGDEKPACKLCSNSSSYWRAA